MKEKPLRMCVVCRNMKPKAELIRVVKNKDGEVFVDKTFKANGRGAYVCRDEQCLTKCIKQKILNKVFKAPIEDSQYESLREDFIGK